MAETRQVCCGQTPSTKFREETSMYRTLITAIVLGAFSMPALAEDMMMKCDDAAMMQAEEHAKMMQGESMSMAMKEVDMAKMAMKDGKTDACMTHLDKAMKQM
jgi:hypothetical protein